MQGLRKGANREVMVHEDAKRDSSLSGYHGRSKGHVGQTPVGEGNLVEFLLGSPSDRPCQFFFGSELRFIALGWSAQEPVRSAFLVQTEIRDDQRS